jgi:dTDP-4-dehydrorhamnose reductase
MSPQLLITGANGQIGWHLQRALSPLGEVRALARNQLDLSDPPAVTRTIRASSAGVVVNAAAYTAVDKAELERELARTINAGSPARMAEECARSGALLIHYSTDYVFDGSKSGPYQEEDPPAPLNVYGQTKLEAEEAIIASGCAHVILRTTWVYDVRGKNFLRTVIRLAREKEELHIVGDQYGAPTWARTIAEATAIIVAAWVDQFGQRETEASRESQDLSAQVIPCQASQTGEAASRSSRFPSGVFHLTAAGQTSWAGFAQAILEDYQALLPYSGEKGEFGGPLKARRVVAITSEQFPTAARRPLNSVLANAKVRAAFGIAVPDWRMQLRLAMQDAIRG